MDYLNFPNLRFPGFEEEWKVEKLGELCKMQAGKFVSASEIINEVDENLFPCYGANGLRGYTKSFNCDGEYSIVGRQGALCGNIVKVTGKFYATEHAVVVTTVDKVNSTWMFYLLIHLNLNQYATGMAQPGLSVQNLKVVESRIPKSVKEQDTIASLLSLLDLRVSTQKKIIEDLEKIKASIAHKMFSRKIKFNNSNDWVNKKLEDLVEFYKGSSLSKIDISSEGKIKCIHYGELFTIYNEVIFSVISRTEKTGFYSKSGDILMPSSDVTPLGLATASTILEDGVLLGGDINILRPLEKINSVFLSYLLNYEKKKIIELVSGTTIKHIYFKDLKGINLNIPFLIEEQNKIAQVLCSIDEKINLEKDLLNRYEIQKKYLLANLFV